MLRASVFFLALVLAFSTASLAQQDLAVVSGDVVDHCDKALPDATVKLHNGSLGVDLTTTTNANGYYLFAAVSPAEEYEVTATLEGQAFEHPSVTFDVAAGATREVLPSFVGDKPADCSKSARWPTSSSDSASLSYGNCWYSGSNGFAMGNVRQGGGGVLRAAYGAGSRAGIRQASYLTALAYSENESGEGQSGSPTPQNNPAGTAAPGSPASGGQHRSEPKFEAKSPKDTFSTAVSTVITSTQLRNLPLFNRNFLALGLLVSSTHDVPAWSELKDTTFSISGQRPTSNAFMIDGMDNVAASSNQAIPFQVNDAVQEFRVVTATSDAQFGRNIGGVVNIVTQRGTTKFNGSVFGFFASDAINASAPLSVYNGTGFDQARAFAGSLNSLPAHNTNPTGSPIYQPDTYNQYVASVQQLNSLYSKSYCTVPNGVYGTAGCNPRFDPASVLAQHDSRYRPFDSQQFGGQAGGWFLKRQTGAWYWFGDYEGTRINNPNPIFERVPSAYDRSHLASFQGQQGYADAQYAQAVLSLYPQSNVVAVPSVLEFYQGQAPNYTNVSNYLGRLDFTQSSSTNWTFRYNLQDLSQLHDDTLPSSSIYPGNGAQRAVLNQNLVLTFTHRFPNGLSNVLRGGFTRFKVDETPQDVNFNPAQVGLPKGAMETYVLSGLDPQYAGTTPKTSSSPAQYGAWGGWFNAVWAPPAVPVMAPSLDGLFPFARIGAPQGAPSKRQDTEFQLVDNVVWFQGRHTVRTGFDLRHLQNIFNNGGFSRGMVVSGDIGEFTSDSETCLKCRQPAFSHPSFDYAIKQPSAYDTTFHSYVIAGYLQDTWRVRPTVTVNLGLRYEYFSPPSETNHQLWNYDPVANGLVRQDQTQVTDTFGNLCGKKGSSGMASIYGLTRTLPWVCSPNGNGSFVVANTTNFEPRVGVAWSNKTGTTVVRAAFGIYYDEIPVSLIAQLSFNRPTAKSQTAPQTLYGQNFNRGACTGQQCGLGNSTLLSTAAQLPVFQAASVPISISAIDPSNLNNPLTRQVSFSVQQDITRGILAEFAYIGNFMANLPATSNTGFNDEWFCSNSAQGNSSQPCDAFSFVPVFTTANIAYGNYNAFVAKVTARPWHELQARASYTYSKGLDNASSAGAPLIPGPLMTQVNALGYYGSGNPLIYSLGKATTGFVPPPSSFSPNAIDANLAALTGLLTAGVNTTGSGRVIVTPYTTPQDPYHFLTNDYGRSDFNQTNRFILEYSWDVKVPKDSKWLQGWMLSGVFTAESGQPFTIFSGPIAGELTQRVSLNGSVTTTGNPYSYIGNTAAIVVPGSACSKLRGAQSAYAIQTKLGIRSGAIGTPCLGNSTRNQFTGPAYVDYDMAVQKIFTWHERYHLSFRAESYNLFNRPNYYNPVSSYSLDGLSPYSQFGQIKSAHNARQFQFAVRMSW